MTSSTTTTTLGLAQVNAHLSSLMDGYWINLEVLGGTIFFLIVVLGFIVISRTSANP
jgi:hypothetical protein